MVRCHWLLLLFPPILTHQDHRIEGINLGERYYLLAGEVEDEQRAGTPGYNWLTVFYSLLLPEPGGGREVN